MIKKIILSSLLVMPLSIMSAHQSETEQLAITTARQNTYDQSNSHTWRKNTATIKQAHMHLNAQDPDQAQQLLQNALACNNITSDEQAKIKLLLAQTHFNQMQKYIAEVSQNEKDQPKAQFCWLQLLFQLNPMTLAERFVKSIESLAKQSSDPKTCAQTKLLLAETYEQKCDTETDYTMRELYDEVANQDSDLQAKVCAQLRLARLYECRRGGKREPQKSLHLCEQAAKQEANPEARIEAQYKLGEKYLSIGLKDLPRAKEYFQAVAQQSLNTELQRKAQEKLKAMGVAE